MAKLQRELPEMQVQPVRQLVEGESKIVDRTHALMYGAVLLIALTVAVSVLATLSASVLERRRDFALMKALGGSQVAPILICSPYFWYWTRGLSGDFTGTWGLPGRKP